MRRNSKMKKRLFALCLALTAFLAMPLTAGAVLQSTSGEMGGYGMRGAVYHYAYYAQAYTECQYSMAYTTVKVDLYCTNYREEKMIVVNSSSEGYASACAMVYSPNDDYVADKAVSTHHVKFGDYQWNPKIESYLYSD